VELPVWVRLPVATQMVLVVKQTKNKGQGIFTNTFIKKGSIIEKSPVIVFKKDDRDLLDMTDVFHYYFYWRKNNSESAIALGYGSLYNHSYTPNAKYIKDYKKRIITFIALRNIKIGEEITVNYNSNPDDKTPLWFKVT
jgi:SET domain-containing protein